MTATRGQGSRDRQDSAGERKKENNMQGGTKLSRGCQMKCLSKRTAEWGVRGGNTLPPPCPPQTIPSLHIRNLRALTSADRSTLRGISPVGTSSGASCSFSVCWSTYSHMDGSLCMDPYRSPDYQECHWPHRPCRQVFARWPGQRRGMGAGERTTADQHFPPLARFIFAPNTKLLSAGLGACR